MKGPANSRKMARPSTAMEGRRPMSSRLVQAPNDLKVKPPESQISAPKKRGLDLNLDLSKLKDDSKPTKGLKPSKSSALLTDRPVVSRLSNKSLLSYRAPSNAPGAKKKQPQPQVDQKPVLIGRKNPMSSNGKLRQSLSKLITQQKQARKPAPVAAPTKSKNPLPSQPESSQSESWDDRKINEVVNFIADKYSQAKQRQYVAERPWLLNMKKGKAIQETQSQAEGIHAISKNIPKPEVPLLNLEEGLLRHYPSQDLADIESRPLQMKDFPKAKITGRKVQPNELKVKVQPDVSLVKKADLQERSKQVAQKANRILLSLQTQHQQTKECNKYDLPLQMPKKKVVPASVLKKNKEQSRSRSLVRFRREEERSRSSAHRSRSIDRFKSKSPNSKPDMLKRSVRAERKHIQLLEASPARESYNPREAQSTLAERQKTFCIKKSWSNGSLRSSRSQSRGRAGLQKRQPQVVAGDRSTISGQHSSKEGRSRSAENRKPRSKGVMNLIAHLSHDQQSSSSSASRLKKNGAPELLAGISPYSNKLAASKKGSPESKKLNRDMQTVIQGEGRQHQEQSSPEVDLCPEEQNIFLTKEQFLKQQGRKQLKKDVKDIIHNSLLKEKERRLHEISQLEEEQRQEQHRKDKIKKMNEVIRAQNQAALKRTDSQISQEVSQKRQSSPAFVIRNQLQKQYSYHSLNTRLGYQPPAPSKPLVLEPVEIIYEKQKPKKRSKSVGVHRRRPGKSKEKRAKSKPKATFKNEGQSINLKIGKKRVKISKEGGSRKKDPKIALISKDRLKFADSSLKQDELSGAQQFFSFQNPAPPKWNRYK